MSDSTDAPSADAGFAQRALAATRRLSGRARAAILAVASMVVAVGVVMSVRAHPEAVRNLDGWYVAAVLAAGVPLMMAANAATFALSGRLLGQRVAPLVALEVAIIGSAANLLPLPGGTVARVAALRVGGSSIRGALGATLWPTLLWAGMSLGYSGVWIAVLADPLLGAGMAALGAVAAGLSAARLAMTSRAGLTSAIAAVQVAMVLIDVVRFQLCLHALGVGASFGEASAFTASAVLGAAIAVVPAGLGVREAAAAAIGPLVGIDPGLGFLAATLNRVLTLAMVAPAGALLAYRAARRAR